MPTPSSCCPGSALTPEREPLFKWVRPTDEARDEYLRTRGFTVDPAPSDMINPKKLLAKRIDLWAAVIRQGSQVLERNGWETQIVPLLVFKEVRVYLACNPAVPDALIERLNQANERIVRDGTARRLERRFDYPPESGNPRR